mmetsp:Transcript_8921/g.28315  ORF Transcript_8921/g.28315 Transcript_8921/m.28315 type:complete len:505 (+) Transcript_8921:357-1871(+)|eukprot:CAMPEP_0197387854 /NCGR_PEP_ID=MMETSP1165-20131217/752_1 /TAXON_ID=284809 /ORGANISM="Chrysocystis fragilis, Strain CCMP3189" /LENGTH=504 /DNA_ID=CAMNT_0042913187 /DNA_START=357 /DNA_END=1871 /DNA_ORIENTATION=+
MSGASNHWAAHCVIAAQQGSQPGATNTGAQQQHHGQQQYAASWQQYGAAWAAQQQQQRQQPYYYNYALQQQQHQQQMQQRIEQVKAAAAASQQPQQPQQRDYGEAVRRATAVAQQTRKSTGMPPSLKAFAERAFATCTTDEERQAMQSKLHGIISNALNGGRLHAMDWATAPIPTLDSATSTTEVAMPPAKKKPRTEAERRQLASRAQRFGPQLATKRGSNHHQAPLIQFEVLEPVKGTCTDLEKDYFRLTSAPDPSVVRPQAVLERSLQRLKDKWRASAVDYDWACNQLKAIRQDLTVQCVKNKFAVNVYETHARVALENADMNEYNQCQTQLKELYASLGDVGHPTEFIAYRILYYIYLQLTAAGGDKSAPEFLAILHEMPQEAWTNDAVSHALAVAEAVNTQNYAAFFHLHKDAPNMGVYILDMCADKIRIDAAYRIAKAHRPSLPLDALARQLGFDEVDDPFVAFVETIGFKLDDTRKLVLTKDSKIDPSALAQQQSSLL